MQQIAVPPATGLPAKPKHVGTWVQTERKAHEAWARLTLKKPSAAAVLHHLCSLMGGRNAVVMPQHVLAKFVGVSERTVSTAIKDLAEEKWIQVVRIGKGKECAYVVNDQVAWGEARKNISMSIFSATVVAAYDDQDAATLEPVQLNRIPQLYPGELQLPSGEGEEPPSQPALPGLEPDLPLIDQSTGEILNMLTQPTEPDSVLFCNKRMVDGTWEGVVKVAGKVIAPVLGGKSPEDLMEILQGKGVNVDRYEVVKLG